MTETYVLLDDVIGFRVSSVSEFRERWLASLDDYQSLVEDGRLDREKRAAEMPVAWVKYGSIRDVVGAAHTPTMSEAFAV